MRGVLVDGDTMRHGDLRWRVLVPLAASTLPMAAWQKSSASGRTAATVIAIGTLPANSESDFPSSAVQTIAREMFGTETLPNIVTKSRRWRRYRAAVQHACADAEDDRRRFGARRHL